MNKLKVLNPEGEFLLDQEMETGAREDEGGIQVVPIHYFVAVSPMVIPPFGAKKKSFRICVIPP